MKQVDIERIATYKLQGLTHNPIIGEECAIAAEESKDGEDAEIADDSPDSRADDNDILMAHIGGIEVDIRLERDEPPRQHKETNNDNRHLRTIIERALKPCPITATQSTKGEEVQILECHAQCERSIDITQAREVGEGKESYKSHDIEALGKELERCHTTARVHSACRIVNKQHVEERECKPVAHLRGAREELADG